MKVELGDGVAHSVHIQLPDRDVLNKSYVRYIASQLFVPVDELDNVLADWTPEQLCEHLKNQDAEALRAQVFGIKK